jgi:hypothetical protein
MSSDGTLPAHSQHPQFHELKPAKLERTAASPNQWIVIASIIIGLGILSFLLWQR